MNALVINESFAKKALCVHSSAVCIATFGSDSHERWLQGAVRVLGISINLFHSKGVAQNFTTYRSSF
jgi:hypothetical protein